MKNTILSSIFLCVLGQKIGQVQSYKCLGTVINKKTKFDENCKSVCKKSHQGLYCHMKLVHFRINQAILKLSFHSFIESVLSFCLVAWLCQTSVTEKDHSIPVDGGNAPICCYKHEEQEVYC